MIPLSLLDRIVALFSKLDISDFGYHTRYEFGDILWALNVKKQKIELRDAYSKIILADDEEARVAARVEYLSKQRLLHEYENDDPPF